MPRKNLTGNPLRWYVYVPTYVNKMETFDLQIDLSNKSTYILPPM
jgi:hypothetical protein